MAPRPLDNSVVHRASYLTRLIGLPLVCFVIALFALNRANASSEQEPERERVEQPAPATPVLSARRVAAALAFPSRTARLNATLEPLVSTTPTYASCAMVATQGGLPIYALNPSLPVSPASNQKLLTSHTALAVLGPDHRFRTTLVTDAPVANGVVQGDVYLVGGGDPVLATPDYAASFTNQPQLFTDLNGLVPGLKAAGITRIQGALVADASRYDDERYVQSWPSRFASGVGENPSGPLSALNLNDGFTSFPSAGQQYGGSGTRTAASNPPLATGQAVGDLLRANGVTIGGGVRVGKATAGATTPLAFVDSPTLAEIVGATLRESDNTASELLLKEIGVAKSAQGSTAAGVAAVTQLLTEQGIAGPELVVVDGSGLSDTNRVTCSLLIRLLAAAGPDGPLAAGLAVAGQSGTLTDRFLGTPGVGTIRAKTGTLSEVSALSGWATTQSGARVIFSIVTNAGDEEALSLVEDQIAVALLTYPEGPTLAELGPKAAG